MSRYQLKSLKAKQLKRVLYDLGYTDRPSNSGGSHGWLDPSRSDLKPVLWAWHDKAVLAPGEVRKVLVKQAGLSLDEAKEVLGT